MWRDRGGMAAETSREMRAAIRAGGQARVQFDGNLAELSSLILPGGLVRHWISWCRSAGGRGRQP